MASYDYPSIEELLNNLAEHEYPPGTLVPPPDEMFLEYIAADPVDARDASGNNVVVDLVGINSGPKLSWTDNGDGTATLDATHDHTGDAISPGTVNTPNLSITQGRGLLGLPTHHVNYASGLASEEVARFTLASGDTLELWRLEASLKGGGTNSNVTLDVYDATNATVLGSVTAGSRAEGTTSPLGTSGAGATITVRLSTGTSAVDMCPTAVTSVVSQ